MIFRTTTRARGVGYDDPCHLHLHATPLRRIRTRTLSSLLFRSKRRTLARETSRAARGCFHDSARCGTLPPGAPIMPKEGETMSFSDAHSDRAETGRNSNNHGQYGMKRLLAGLAVALGLTTPAFATNDYFDSGDYTPLTDHTLARASSINSVLSAIEVGFDRVQTGSAAFFTAESSSVVTIGTGAKVFTISSGKAYVEGTLVLITDDASGANYMFGPVTSYSGTTLTVDVQVVGGSGTLNDWIVSMTGLRGLTGPAGSGTGDLLAANNLSDVANATTARTNLGTVAKAGDTFTGNVGLLSTDAGAAAGPTLTLDRDSASPAANDVLANIPFVGEDSAGNDQTYAQVDSLIIDPTSGSEDAAARLIGTVAGATHTALSASNGVIVGSPTGSYQGTGTINATTYYMAGTALVGNPTYLLVQDQKADGTAGGSSTAAWTTRTLNTTVLNTISGASVGSNQVTLPAGTYLMFCEGVVYTNMAQQRILNATDTAVVVKGGYNDVGISGLGRAVSASGVVAIAAQKAFACQTRVDTGRATDGYGQATSWAGEVEVYVTFMIVKIG